MRRVRYQVATSLDGYLAGPEGEHDWIVMDPEISFEARLAEFPCHEESPPRSSPWSRRPAGGFFGGHGNERIPRGRRGRRRVIG